MTLSRQPKRISWLGGLVLVLAFLAHDVLMASVAQGAPEMPVTVHEHGSSDQASDIVVGMPDRDPQPVHPRDCSTTGNAILAAGPQLETTGFGSPAVLVDCDLVVPAPSAVGCWAEPHWPPGTRRAWLQVYRI